MGRGLALKSKGHTGSETDWGVSVTAVGSWEGQNLFPELNFLKLTRHQMVNLHKIRIQFKSQDFPLQGLDANRVYE